MDSNYCNACKSSIMFVCCEDCLCCQCKNTNCHILHCYPYDDVAVTQCKKFVSQNSKDIAAYK